MPETRDTFEDLPILIELRRSLDEAFTLDDLRQPARPRRRWTPLRELAPVTRYRSRRLALAAGAVASLAAAGIVGLQGGGVTQSALAATMDHLAQVAASRDWSGLPGPGQYVYIEVEAAYFDPSDTTGTTCAVQLDHDQWWIQSDYSSENSHGLIYQSKFTSPTGAAGCAAIGLKDASNLDGGTITHQGPENSPFPTTVGGWQALTTDPKTLLQKIHELDGGDNTPAEEFVNISDALKAIPVPVANYTRRQVDGISNGRSRPVGPRRRDHEQGGLHLQDDLRPANRPTASGRAVRPVRDALPGDGIRGAEDRRLRPAADAMTSAPTHR